MKASGVDIRRTITPLPTPGDGPKAVPDVRITTHVLRCRVCGFRLELPAQP